jgi:hypothetical protein
MKKLLILLCVALSTTAFAQTFQLGLKGGINISNFNGGDFNTIKNKALVGYHAGAFLRLRYGHLAIQPAVLLSTQGATLENAGNEQDYKITYVNVPVLLQYQTDGGFYLEAGPQVGFKVDEDIPNSTIDDFAKSTDLSLAFGLGYFSRMGLGVGARYNVGVSKVGDFDASNIDPDFRNGVLQFSVFYSIFGNRK